MAEPVKGRRRKCKTEREGLEKLGRWWQLREGNRNLETRQQDRPENHQKWWAEAKKIAAPCWTSTTPNISNKPRRKELKILMLTEKNRAARAEWKSTFSVRVGWVVMHKMVNDETSYSKGRRGKTLTGKERVLRKKKGKIVLKMAKSPCFITTKNNNNNNNNNPYFSHPHNSTYKKIS